MSLKIKFFVIGIAASLLSVVIAVTSIIGLQSFTGLMHDTEIASQALRNHMTGDMMHDGLRSDVYSALYAAEYAPQDRGTVLDSVKEHAELFHQMMAANRELPLPENVRETLGALSEPLNIYIEMAQSLSAAAFQDRQTAIAMLPEFDERYEALEGTMAAASDAIEGIVSSASTRADSLSDFAQTAMTTALVLSILIGIGIIFFMWSSLAQPLVKLAEIIRRLAEGDFEAPLAETSRKDEIGDMMRAAVVFRDHGLERANMEAEQEQQKQRAEAEKKALMHKLADEFDASVSGIVETVSSTSVELNSTARSMAGIAEETSSKAGAVGSASEEASANVSTVASATEEMSNSIAEINGQVMEAAKASRKAVEDVATTAQRMNALAQTADKIGEVVSLISDIAEQTNLLALNATIESARAGEAGRGFAVVASEVKALANETAKATEGISHHIEEIQSATGEAVTSIDEIGKIIKQLEETSTAIAAAMEEQGATTQDVARNVSEAASGTRQVSENIAGLTKTSQETGAAARQVTSSAEHLSSQAEALKREVGNFISQVRAS